MLEAVLALLYSWRLSFEVVGVAVGNLWLTPKYTTPRGSSLSAKVTLANRPVSLMVAPEPTWKTSTRNQVLYSGSYGNIWIAVFFKIHSGIRQYLTKMWSNLGKINIGSHVIISGLQSESTDDLSFPTDDKSGSVHELFGQVDSAADKSRRRFVQSSSPENLQIFKGSERGKKRAFTVNEWHVRNCWPYLTADNRLPVWLPLNKQLNCFVLWIFIQNLARQRIVTEADYTVMEVTTCYAWRE